MSILPTTGKSFRGATEEIPTILMKAAAHSPNRLYACKLASALRQEKQQELKCPGVSGLGSISLRTSLNDRFRATQVVRLSV